MEAIILAGGKAERLGDAAEGKPKALCDIGGRPLAAYQLAQLVRAGVDRVIVSCAIGKEDLFDSELAGLGAEIVPVAEPEPLGRGGGLRFAARAPRDDGPLFALNGDELIDVDLAELLEKHREAHAAATLVVAPLVSHLGVVDVDEQDTILGFREAPRLAHWVNCGVYVLDEEALQRLPERGDHEQSTFPELALEGKLHAFRHEGLWLTVNTPKDKRRAEEYVRAHPEWLAVHA
jgi:NDP-sugar pyrophosphorylase family protein